MAQIKTRTTFPLGAPSKMPGAAWGISALRCITGAKLAQEPGTICNSCYALAGHYRYPNVLDAHERRLDAWKSNRTQWIDEMACTIALQTTRLKENRFRWFDAGDLQSADMLRDIIEVARKTPKVRHWLPTKEYGFVKEVMTDPTVSIPTNLTIRLSALKIDAKAPALFGLPGSGVVTDKAQSNCQAYRGETVNCLDCDKCWNANEREVYYPLH